MLQELAEDITFFLAKNKIIDMDERDIYIYGFQLLISSLLITITILFIGFLFNKFFLTILFVIVYVLLRAFTGGYHANYYWQCYLISNSIYISVLIINYIVPQNNKIYIGLFAFIFSTIIILLFAPVENIQNPKTEKLTEKNKKISRFIVFVLSIIMILGHMINKDLIDLWFVISMAELAVAILILIPTIRRNRKWIKSSKQF